MSNLLERLASGEILVSDGAMGTFLQARGLKAGECPEVWCVTHPEVVREIGLSYVQAGSDIIETNTFGGTSFKLREFGMADRTVEFNMAAARLAKEAAGGQALVAASVGPTGQIVESEGGTASETDLYEAYREQVMALEHGGADALCIETMSSVAEAAQAVRAAGENTHLPVICTFTFEAGARGFRTMMGVDPARAVSEALEAGANIVGANCGNGIENMIEIARQIRQAAPDALLMVQANAGMPVYQDGRTIFPASPEQMASHVKDLIEAGVSIIGGCCGTTPEHIRQMALAARG